MKSIICLVLAFFLVFSLTLQAGADEDNALEASLTGDEISDTEAEFDRLRAERMEEKDPAETEKIEKEELLEEGETELDMN